MKGFKIFQKDEYWEDDKKTPMYCSYCKKEIAKDYYYDSITFEVYCCRECYLKKINDDYFE